VYFALSIWGRLELLFGFDVLLDLIDDYGPNDLEFVADSPLERPCPVIYMNDGHFPGCPLSAHNPETTPKSIR
jgi:hypothetical protein